MARGLSTVIALIGLPGAGKSTLARALHDALGWPVIDRDRIRAALFDPVDGSEVQKRAASRAAALALDARLASGVSVILDGQTFATRAARRTLAARCRRAPARLLWVLLDCPPAEARRRVARAGRHPAPDRDPALVDAVARRMAPAPRAALRLDARTPTAQLVAAVRRRLRDDGAAR